MVNSTRKKVAILGKKNWWFCDDTGTKKKGNKRKNPNDVIWHCEQYFWFWDDSRTLMIEIVISWWALRKMEEISRSRMAQGSVIIKKSQVWYTISSSIWSWKKAVKVLSDKVAYWWTWHRLIPIKMKEALEGLEKAFKHIIPDQFWRKTNQDKSSLDSQNCIWK